MTFSKLTAFAAVLCISLSTFADTIPIGPAPSPIAPGGKLTLLTDHTFNRHFGFFIRPDLGLGYMSSSEATNTSLGDMTISGLAGVAGLSIGGAIAENVILSAHIYDAVSSNPTVSVASGQSANTSNASVTMFGVGPELTYYIMPANVYLSGTVALSRMTLTANGRDANTDYGFGTRLTLGKEWWVSSHWGLGLAGHISYASNNDPDSQGGSHTLTSLAYGVAFSATYN
jgi:hypothetical protein